MAPWWTGQTERTSLLTVGAAASVRVVLHHLIHPLDRKQFRARAGMARLAAALAATALAPLGRPKARPSLEGGLEELRELRPIRSRSSASSVAKAVSCAQSCSFSSRSACTWPTISRTLAGVAAQSASEIPAGGALIAGGLYLRCNRESGRRQGFSRIEVRHELSRPLNAYDTLNQP